MKYLLIVLVVIVLIVLVLYEVYKPSPTDPTVPETYVSGWRMPMGSEYREIGKLIVENNIKVCGEYHVKETAYKEYIIACTADGIKWEYFVVKIQNNRLYRADKETMKNIPPPKNNNNG